MLIERAERGDRCACFGGFPVDTAHGLGQCAVVHRGNFLNGRRQRLLVNGHSSPPLTGLVGLRPTASGTLLNYFSQGA